MSSSPEYSRLPRRIGTEFELSISQGKYVDGQSKDDIPASWPSLLKDYPDASPLQVSILEGLDRRMRKVGGDAYRDDYHLELASPEAESPAEALDVQDMCYEIADQTMKQAAVEQSQWLRLDWRNTDVTGASWGMHTHLSYTDQQDRIAAPVVRSENGWVAHMAAAGLLVYGPGRYHVEGDFWTYGQKLSEHMHKGSDLVVNKRGHVEIRGNEMTSSRWSAAMQLGLYALAQTLDNIHGPAEISFDFPHEVSSDYLRECSTEFLLSFSDLAYEHLEDDPKFYDQGYAMVLTELNQYLRELSSDNSSVELFMDRAEWAAKRQYAKKLTKRVIGGDDEHLMNQYADLKFSSVLYGPDGQVIKGLGARMREQGRFRRIPVFNKPTYIADNSGATPPVGRAQIRAFISSNEDTIVTQVERDGVFTELEGLPGLISFHLPHLDGVPYPRVKQAFEAMYASEKDPSAVADEYIQLASCISDDHNRKRFVERVVQHLLSAGLLHEKTDLLRDCLSHCELDELMANQKKTLIQSFISSSGQLVDELNGQHDMSMLNKIRDGIRSVDIDAVLSITAQLGDTNVARSAINEIVGALLEANDYDSVLALVSNNDIPMGGDIRAGAAYDVYEHLLSAGDAESAAALLDAFSDGAKDLFARKIVGRLRVIDDRDVGLGDIEEVMSFVRSLMSGVDGEEALIESILTFAVDAAIKHGGTKAAEEYLIKTQATDQYMWSTLGYEYFFSGDVASAIRVVKRLGEHSQSGELLDVCAEDSIAEGDLDSAFDLLQLADDSEEIDLLKYKLFIRYQDQGNTEKANKVRMMIEDIDSAGNSELALITRQKIEL